MSAGTALIVSSNVQAILKCLELLGFESSGYDLEPTVEHYKQRVREMKGDWMGWFKWKLAAFIAVGKSHVPPPAPGSIIDAPEVLLGGRAMKWLRLVERTDKKRYEETLASLGTVKRAMNRPEKPELDAALTKTFKLLTTERKFPSPEECMWAGVAPASAFEREELLDEVRRTTREIFKGKSFTFLDTLKPFFPSTNANYLSTRSKGGAVGHIMESTVLDGLKSSKPLISWESRGKGKRSQRVHVDDAPLLERWRVAYERIIEAAEGEEKRVKLVSLAEALKVRVISKGPVMTYTALKPLQVWLWKTLRNHNSGVFDLIGEEISDKYLEKQIGSLKGEESYLSGDYSAATDNIDPALSEAVVDVICECIEDRRLAKLFKESLTGHLIDDPDKEGRSKPQKWGQLMGSVVSFPVLCVVNASICRRTREFDIGRSLTLGAAKIAVNGDDCIFRATTAGRSKWESLANASGMVPSVGKYFFSKEFCNMNSADYRINQAKELSPSELEEKVAPYGFMEWIPRINMGLAVGQGRTTSGKMDQSKVNSWGGLNSISKNAHTLVAECAEQDAVRVFKYYLNKNWTLLKGTRLPWFLPEHLGGLGLPIFPDHVVKDEKGVESRPWAPTDIDKRLAAAVVQYGKPIAKRPEGVSWKVWEYASARARTFPKDTIHSSYEHVSDMTTGESAFEKHTLMSRLVVEALFTQPFSKVYRESREDNLTLRAVEKENKRLIKLMGKVDMRSFSLDDIFTSAKDAPELNPGLNLNPRTYVSLPFLNNLFDENI